MEKEVVNGKYVVEDDTGDFEWHGFLVNGKMTRMRKPPPPPPRTAARRMAVRTNPNPRHGNSDTSYGLTALMDFMGS